MNLKYSLLSIFMSSAFIACSDSPNSSENDDIISETSTTTITGTGTGTESDTDTNIETSTTDTNTETTTTDIEIQPLPTFSVQDFEINENDSSHTFTIDLSHASPEAFDLQLSLESQSGEVDADISQINQSISINENDSSFDIILEPIDDDLFEQNEIVNLVISNGETESTSVITILDDGDSAPVARLINDLDIRQFESDTQLSIEVSLDKPTGFDTSIEVTAIFDNADLNDIQIDESITFAKGESQSSLNFTILQDDQIEGLESFSIQISSSDNNSIIDDTQSKADFQIHPQAVSLSGGSYASCVVYADQAVRCFGYNDSYNFLTGQAEDIGDGYGEAQYRTAICHQETQEVLTALEILEPDSLEECPRHINTPYLIHSGVDANNNSILDLEEYSDVQTICHDPSRPTADYLYSNPIDLAPGKDCEFGGVEIFSGWDENDDGELLSSEMGEHLIVSKLPTDTKLVSLHVGEYVNCGLFDDNTTRCSGENNRGALSTPIHGDYIGDEESELYNNLPVIDFGTDLYAKSLAVGDNQFCAILNNDRVKCWGSAQSGIIGYGNLTNIGELENQMGDNLAYVDLGTNDQGEPYKVLQMSAGYSHTCALLETNQVKCWGRNSRGELGYEDIITRGDSPNEMGNNLPFVNLGDVEVQKVYTAYIRTCALTTDNELKCWGFNSSGELGLGLDKGNIGAGDYLYNYEECHSETQNVISKITIQEPDINNCEFGGYLLQMGYDTDNNGELSDEEFNAERLTWSGDCHSQEYDIQVIEEDLTSENSNCEFSGKRVSIRKDYGKDGVIDSEMGNQLPSIELGNTTGIKDLAMGYYATCVLFNDNQLKCWGDDEYHALENGQDWGDEAGETPATAISPDLGTNRYAVEIEGRGYQLCAILDNADVKCWGYSDNGETGYPEYYSDTIGDNDAPTELGDKLPAVDLY